VRTLIVSDLHVGTHTRTDVLRRPAALSALLAALDGVDRLVLLGDAIELRSGPLARALADARPVFAALGRALAGREVLLVPGNHDHALIAPWLERRLEPLGSEVRVAAADASPAAAELAGCLGPGARLELAYPGLWVSDGVYATHGHYLDCHMTVPTVERIAIGLTARFAGAGAEAARRPEDYEALVAPVYAWIHAVAQSGRPGAVNGSGSARAWRALARPGGGGGGGGRPRPGLPLRLRARAIAAGFPLAVAGLNRAGLGPLRSELSTDELRRGRLLALGDVVAGLGIDARHVIFGHTHRAGPLPGDDPREWTTRAAAAPAAAPAAPAAAGAAATGAGPSGPGGARLHNCGSWVLETHLMTRVAPESPYWPGGCVIVDDDDPAPRLERLLGGLSAVELA
jgi:hypothetical protein